MVLFFPGRVVSNAFKPIFLSANITLPAAVQASGAITGTVGKLTFTAKKYGTYGNDIQVVLVDGVSAGSESATVSGTVITVEIETGVSTAAQIKTEIEATATAAALITVVETTSGAMEADSVTLSSGAGDGSIVTGDDFITSLLPTATGGQYELILKDKFYAGLGFFASIHASDASTSSTVAKVELMNADAFTTDLAAGNTLELHAIGFDGAEEVVAAENNLHLLLIVSDLSRN